MLFGLAMVGPIFSQSGWNNVTFTGAEVRKPERNLPVAILFGSALVVVLYLCANFAYIVTLPLEGIQQAHQNRVGTAMMESIVGPAGAIIMAIAIMISTLGTNNGLIIAGARVYYAMACDKLFFSSVGRINSRHVPGVALVTQCIWASLLTLPRSVTTNTSTGAVTFGNMYTQLLEYKISADLIFFGLMIAAVIVLRRKAPNVERPYRAIGYPVTPLIYLSLATLIILDLAYLAPSTSGISYLLMLSSIPVYLLWRGRVRRRSALSEVVSR
jgi:APA family basic amino acid/polyamine antiporter